MLLALLAAFFMTGGTSGGAGIVTEQMVDQVIQQVELVVTDPERAKQAENTLAGVISEIQSFNKKLDKSGEALAKLYLDHNAGTDSMQANLDALDREWHAAQLQIIEQHFQLKKSINADEWAVIFAEK